MKRYNVAKPWERMAETSPGPPPGREMETMIPTRPASFVSDLVVPLGQAAVTGALLGAVVVFVLAEVKPGWEVNLVKVWGAVALVIAALAWLLLLMDTRRLLWAIERLTGLDLDNNNAIGKPQERVIVVNAGQARQEAAQQAAQQAAAARRSDFARFVAALPVKGTSQRAWEGELGRETYQEYRDVLLRTGWARWNSTKRDGTPNETKGWALVLTAAEILERVSE